MSGDGELRLKIEKLVAGGDGLAFVNGKAVFVPFALPGEIALASIREERKDFCRARLNEILEPSPERAQPACPLYGECGGCNLQHLEYGAQVEQKRLLAEEAFSRNARIETGKIEVLSSAPLGYRNRMQLHFTKSGRLGLMRRSSSEVIEAPSCPVATDSIRAWIEERAGTSRGYEEMRPYIAGKERFLAFGYGKELWLEGRQGVVSVEVAGRDIRFHMRGFFQSNLRLLDRLVEDAVEGLSGGRAADLYCGVGLFGSFLASSFESLVCVEENPYSIDLARDNVRGARPEFRALPVEDWIRDPSAAKDFDLVLVDPPRTGLASSVRSWLAKALPKRIVYVSCDQTTLARDAGELVRSGYTLDNVKVYDFYPQTSHLECLARFSRA